MALVLLGGVANFDRKVLLTPAMLTSMFAMADERATGSKAAVKEARSGDLGGAAMTALGENDQVLATFLKGLELYQSAQLDKAAIQFQNSMQMAPTLRAVAAVPRRRAGGRQPAQGSRGADPERVAPTRRTRRSRGSPAKSGSRRASPRSRSRRWSARCRSRRGPGREEAAGHCLCARRPVERRGRRADAVPRRQSDRYRGAAGGDLRHIQPASSAPQPATLAADRANMAKWSKAYAATKGPMQPLVAAWGKHVQELK